MIINSTYILSANKTYLQAVTVLAFFTYYIQHIIHQFRTFGVMTFSPIITGSRLAEYEVVWTEKLSIGAGAHRFHGTWLEIEKNGTGHIFAARGTRHS